MRVRIHEVPSKKELERLYVTEFLGSGDISDRLGISRPRIQYWLKKYEIPMRSKAEAASLREKKPAVIEFRSTQLAAAQSKITAEGRRRQAEKISGPRSPWTDEQRAAHAYRSDPAYRKKISDAQKGDKAHRWRGGITPDEVIRLHSWEWRQRRSECYARDNWTCQHCQCKCLSARQSKNERGRRIQAHHILPRRDGGSDDLLNLITLCASCHHKQKVR